MRRTLLLTALLLAAAPARGQISLGGTLDVAYRNAGPDARPLLNDTPTPYGTVYVPAARLFAAADLSPRWWAQAVLQADYYGNTRLNPAFFSLLNLNWQVLDAPLLVLQAGRIVLPFGLESERYLAFDNPFVHLSLLHEWNLRVDPEIGFFRDTPAYDAWPGQSVVYARMYTQGVAASGVAGRGERLTYAAAVTTAPASTPLEAGYHGRPAGIGRLTFRPTIWSRLGLSATHGPYLRRSTANDMLTGAQVRRYTQTAFSGDLNLNYAYVDAGLQYTRSRWTAPWLDRTWTQTGPDAPVSTRGFRLQDEAVRLSAEHLMAEAVVNLPFFVGAYVGVRFERMRFDGPGTGDTWMPAYDRVQVVAGRKLNRNLIARVAYAAGANPGPAEFADAVFTLLLSAQF